MLNLQEADRGRERAGEASCHQVLPLHAGGHHNHYH